MKRFSLLFFLFLISTFHAFAQTHFITAGQTQGMIFTDYVDYITLFPGTLGYFTYSIDLNHDEFLDVEFSKYSSNTGGMGGHGGAGSNQTSITPLSSNFEILCSYDTAIDDGYGCNPTYYYQTKRFVIGDSINNADDFYYGGKSYINHVDYYNGGGACYFGIWGVVDTSYYISGRMISNNDTSLFYIHFGYPGYKIFDYAIEGYDTTYLISFVTNLSPSNISISPNPFTNQISINTEKPFQYTITDYSGRLLLSGTSDKTIATETIPAGSYLLTIKNEEVFSVKKMVKAIW